MDWTWTWKIKALHMGGSYSPARARMQHDFQAIPGVGFCYVLGMSLREGNGNPLQYSCLETPMDGGAW